MGVDCCLIALSWELVVGCLFPFPKFRLNSSVELTNNDHPNVRRNRPITTAFFLFYISQSYSCSKSESAHK